MDFQVGDKVRVIDEAAQGIVTGISGNTIMVDIDDFEFPYSSEKLIKLDSNDEKLYVEYSKNEAPNKDLPPGPTIRVTLSKKEKIEELGRVRGKRNPRGILEFDLHIHDLLVTHKGMHPGEMLDYQKEYAINCIEESIQRRETTIIFIHGIGKGILKSELLKIFRDYGFKYEDASRREYGIGATEVLLS